MPYLDTAQQWLTQSALLLQARPATTLITTKYTLLPIPDPSAPRSKRARKSKTPQTTDTTSPPLADSAAATAPPQQEPIRATLTLKTYDPASGVTLKYSTTKAAEVSRLIQILGKLGRGMAGLPEVKEDVVMADAEGSGVATPVVETAPKLAVGAAGQGGVGKKKKGKGKK